MPTPRLNYTFDPAGTSAANRITGEQHVITENNNSDYYFVVPKYAPFFLNSFTAVRIVNGVTTPLVEGTDFYAALPYIGATRSIGVPVYGAISFSNLNITGIVQITYQTLGGEWVIDDQQIV